MEFAKKKHKTISVTNLRPTIPDKPILGVNPSSKYQSFNKNTRRVRLPKINEMIPTQNELSNNNQISDGSLVDDEITLDIDDSQNNIMDILQNINQKYLRTGRIGKNNRAYSIDQLQFIAERLEIPSITGKRKKDLIQMIKKKLADYGMLEEEET